MEAIDFVEYDITFLNLSWDWLNDPEIKFLTDTPDFSRDQQLSWFEGLKNRSDYKVWGIRIGAERIGVCGLKNITNSSAEYFGYIADKSFWGKGFGKFLLEFTCKKAIEMGLETVQLKVLNNNVRAVKSYKNFGFIVSEKDSTYTFMTIKTR